MSRIKLIQESVLMNGSSQEYPDVTEVILPNNKPDYSILDITVIPDDLYNPTIQSILISLDQEASLKESDSKLLDINILSETVNTKTGYSNSLFEFESSDSTITLSLVLQETEKQGVYKVEAYTTRGVKVFETHTLRPKETIKNYLNSLANEYLISKPIKESTDNTEWIEICKAFCKKIGAELLFVNDDNFGYETKDGQLVHMYADELEQYLKNNKLEESDDKENSIKGYKKDLIKKFPELKDKDGFKSYADDDYLAIDFNTDGSIKGYRLTSKLEEAEDPIIADVKEDLAIEPGSDEEAMLDEIYEEPETDDEEQTNEEIVGERLADKIINNELKIDYSNWNQLDKPEKVERVEPKLRKFMEDNKNVFQSSIQTFFYFLIAIEDASLDIEREVLDDLYDEIVGRK